MEYLDQLGLLAMGSRLKRLSDIIMTDGNTIYKNSSIDFDPKWFPVFHLLSEESPLGIMEIAEKLKISHPYVIQLVKGLEKKGLILNVNDSRDARKRSIRLSDKGTKLLQELKPLWDDIQQTMENVLRESNNPLFTAVIQLENSFEEKSFYQRVMETRKERMLANVEIINYTPENKHWFKTLNIEWLEKYFVVEPIDEKVLGQPDKYIIDTGGAIIFAKIEDDIVGTCALKWKEGKTYELTKMAVTDKAQGLQIGKKLGLRILEVAKKLKAETVFLESNRRLTPALSLYRKLGFIEKPNPYASDYVRSDIYMEVKV